MNNDEDLTAIKILSSEEKNEFWDDKVKKKWTINLFFGCILLFSSRNAMAVCVPAISKELGWNKEISGMALSAFFFGYVGSNVVGGYLADRHGGARMIFYSTFVWSILTIVLPLFVNASTVNSGNFSILAVRFFTGCTQGFFFPSFSAIISKNVKTSEKGIIIGIVYSGCSIGIILTGLFGSALIEHGYWHLVFIINGIFSFIWAFWLRNLHYTTKLKECKKKGTEKPEVASYMLTWKQILSKSSVWAMLVAFLGSGCTYTVLASWSPVYFHDIFPDSKGWIFNVAPWLLSFIFENMTGYYANLLLRNGMSVTNLRKIYAAILFTGTMVFSLLLTYVTSFSQALVLMSLTAAFSAFGSSSISMNPQDLCPKQTGSLFGVANAVASIGGSMAVYLTGLFLEKSGNNWSFVFMCNALISVSSGIVFVLFSSTETITA